MSTSSPSQPFRFSSDSPGGHFASYSAAANAETSDEGLLRETRKELRKLVSDISTLCHSRIDPKAFWPKFLTLVGTAIAAEGGVIWKRNAPASSLKGPELGGNRRDWDRVTHCGLIDDRILTAANNCHCQMIAEVGDSGGPVVVPPGADWDSDEPGNPTSYLAAVVPVPVDPDEPVHWMLELFLPPGGGPATQRGYLRFLAQMTDLAAEYMRGERLRAATWKAEFSDRAARTVASLQEIIAIPNFYRGLCDAVSQFTGSDRVSLVYCNASKAQVFAVSGVATIDRYSDTVHLIGQVANEAHDQIGLHLAEIDDCSSEQCDLAADESDEKIVQSGQLHLRGVAVLDSACHWRLVIEDAVPKSINSDEVNYWQLFSRQVASLIQHHQQITRPGFARLWSSSNASSPSLLRRSLVPLGITLIIGLAAIIPAPMVISAKGHLQPEALQTLYAPRPAVVAEILVSHDQLVQKGQAIIKLQDDDLSQQIEQTISRLAILSEQTAANLDEQARADGLDVNLLEELVLRQKSIAEETRSLNTQLSIYKQIEESLTLYAPCDGRIDAWQVKRNLQNRPVDRGQPLIQIVPESKVWQVQAEIPQSRLNTLLAFKDQAGKGDEQIQARMILAAFPDRKFFGDLKEIGPVFASKAVGSDSQVSLATLSVNAEDLPLKQTGAPVEIGIPCGYRPLGYLVTQDLIELATQAVQLYW